MKTVCFSPAGETRLVAEAISAAEAEALITPDAGELVREDTDDFALPGAGDRVRGDTDDFTLPGARNHVREYKEDDLVVFAMPTYAGRLPNKIAPEIRRLFRGNGAKAIAVVTYGGRAYESSLNELINELTAAGFRVIEGRAYRCRHVFFSGEDNPPGQTYSQAESIRPQKNPLEAGDYFAPPETPLPVGDYYVPLGEDGEPVNFLKAKPKTAEAKCDNCGICAERCPMGSISFEDFSQVPGICIKCQACVIHCPQRAKYFDDPGFLSHVRMLRNTL